MKRTLALLLAMLTLLALPACGADQNASPAAPVRSTERAGSYKLIRLVRDGETTDFEEQGLVEEMAKTSGLTLNADGTGVFLSGGKERPITWDDANIVLDNDAIMCYSFENGVITIIGAGSELWYRRA